MKEKNGNTYIRQHGLLHAYDGRVTNGEWIDVIRSQDFIHTRIDEEVFRTVYNAGKVPYDPAGFAMIGSAVESPLQTAANNGMIATDEDKQFMYSVTVPKVSEASANDRANRKMPPVQFEMRIAGAVHGGKIEGIIKA